MILSRAAFGVRGNALPSVIGYLILVGWEIVLVTLATLATNTVLGRLGWATGNASLIISFLIIAAIIMAAGILGFDAIMKVQTWITWATAVLTVAYIALTISHINLSAVMAIPAGSFQAVIGALVLAMTGFGLSWANSASDYSRYLPRSASSTGVVGWTTFGASVAPSCSSSTASCSPVPTRPQRGGQQRPHRRADRHPSALVPGAVRDRRDPRPGRRRRPGHLLVRADAARARAAREAVAGRGPRRCADDHRHHLHRVVLAQLHRPVPGLPHHARRPAGRVGGRVPRRPDAAPSGLPRHGALRCGRALRVGQLGLGRARGDRLVHRVGLVTNTMASFTMWQGYLLGPLGVRRARGRTRTSASSWPS
nr:cytosine permease [Tessaracoccus coleopterorum]